MTDTNFNELYWKARKKKRRRKSSLNITSRELNLVAMMDMLTIILVFLLKSYSVSAMSLPVGEEINVPISSHLLNPKEAVKLVVTKTGKGQVGVIAVDESKILALDEEKLKQLYTQTKQRQFLIPELFRELSKKAETIKLISTHNTKVKFEGQISIIADKQTPYWLITQILYTSAEAQFDKYNLVAIRESQ